MLQNAHDSATTLLEDIQERYPDPSAPEELVIVAHSLGCRLVLDMLTAMGQRGRPIGLKRFVVILMAAAVPISTLGVGRPARVGSSGSKHNGGAS